MLPLTLADTSAPLTVLCIGAHSDDLEIGCGGTLLRLLSERDVLVRWMVLGCSPVRAEEARRSAEAMLARSRESRIDIHGFRDAFFPYEGERIKEVFERVKQDVVPDLVFTHTRDDLHQDHRLVNQLTWNTFRDHLILEYEIPKYDGDTGNPNTFVRLDERTVQAKVAHLMCFFQSQRDKRWFDEDTFRGLMRLRGVQAGVRYAEAFHSRKVLL